MMNTNLWLNAVVLAGCLALSQPSQAEHTVVSTDSSAGLKGAISDYLFYTIGGGSVISPPPGHSNMEKLSFSMPATNSEMIMYKFQAAICFIIAVITFVSKIV